MPTVWEVKVYKTSGSGYIGAGAIIYFVSVKQKHLTNSTCMCGHTFITSVRGMAYTKWAVPLIHPRKILIIT